MCLNSPLITHVAAPNVLKKKKKMEWKGCVPLHCIVVHLFTIHRDGMMLRSTLFITGYRNFKPHCAVYTSSVHTVH